MENCRVRPCITFVFKCGTATPIPAPLAMFPAMNFLPFAVPSAPENLNAANVLANQFTVVWEPPFIPNGIIQFYVVFVQGAQTLNPVPDSFFQVQQFIVSDSPLTITAMPYSLYLVDVFAVTSAGGGDFNGIQVLTAEASEFVCNRDW